MVREKKYMSIVEACEGDLELFGDTFEGQGWTKKPEYADRRYKIMLEGIRPDGPGPIKLLDFGCGTSRLYEYILEQKIDTIEYSGLDISEKYLSVSRKKFPNITYYQMDVLDGDAGLPQFDFIVLNGVFNSKCEQTQEEMLDYYQTVVRRMFRKARLGIAFNVMSKQVEWERDDLFHLPFDTLAGFLVQHVSRDFVIRHDYGLYEYTTYVYHKTYE